MALTVPSVKKSEDYFHDQTSDKAKHFEGYVAFYKDRVDVVG